MYVCEGFRNAQNHAVLPFYIHDITGLTEEMGRWFFMFRENFDKYFALFVAKCS